MKFFRLLGSQAYKSISYEDDIADEKFEIEINGTPLSNEWEKCKVEVVFRGELAKTKVDIMDFAGTAGVVFTSKAKKLLQDLILPYCEFLPVELGKNTVYILNPTAVLDCLDMEKSETEKVPPLNWEKITKPVYKISINYPPIFRIANEPNDIIVTDEFVARLKENNIEGYILWDFGEKE